jgi:hypothetical protein
MNANGVLASIEARLKKEGTQTVSVMSLAALLAPGR